MSNSKSSYPERPPSPKPKKPGKGRGRPSSSKSTQKAKVFQTLMVGDKQVKTGGPWYRSPHRKLWGPGNIQEGKVTL